VSSSAIVFHTFVYVCVCVCVCERERACACVSHSETQQKSVSQPGNWPKLAIWEEWRAATLVVIVFLMRVVPCHRAPMSHDDHVCVRMWLPVCLCMSIATTYTGEHCKWYRVVRL